jgi:transposase
MFSMSQPVLGIDVGKSKLYIALLMPNGKSKPKVIPNTPEGHQELLTWLNHHQVSPVHACLEATGVYGDAVAEVLYQANHTVSIVNPARVLGFAKSELRRTKNDKVDAALIARFCAALRPAPWTPAAPEVKHLQALVRRLEALNVMRQQEYNRLAVSTELVATLIKEHLNYLEQDIQKTKQLIRDHFDQHPGLKQQEDLLRSIPGIGEVTASVILAEVQSWDVFVDAKQLAAYMGLTPQEKTSGTSVRGRSQISRTGNGRLRKALYMPAMVSQRFNPLIKTFCERLLSKGKNKMQVIVAAMRKLAHLIFGVLKSGKPFDPNYLSITP